MKSRPHQNDVSAPASDAPITNEASESLTEDFSLSILLRMIHHVGGEKIEQTYSF